MLFKLYKKIRYERIGGLSAKTGNEGIQIYKEEEEDNWNRVNLPKCKRKNVFQTQTITSSQTWKSLYKLIAQSTILTTRTSN